MKKERKATPIEEALGYDDQKPDCQDSNGRDEFGSWFGRFESLHPDLTYMISEIDACGREKQ